MTAARGCCDGLRNAGTSVEWGGDPERWFSSLTRPMPHNARSYGWKLGLASTRGSKGYRRRVSQRSEARGRLPLCGRQEAKADGQGAPPGLMRYMFAWRSRAVDRLVGCVVRVAS